MSGEENCIPPPSYLQGTQQTVQQMRQFQHHCRICGETEGLRRCSRCQVAYYCCQDHQRLDWRVHKLECRSIHQLQQQSPSSSSSGGLPGEPGMMVLPQATAVQQQQYAISQNQGIYRDGLMAMGADGDTTTSAMMGQVPDGAGRVGMTTATSVLPNATMTLDQPTIDRRVFANATGVRAEILSTNGLDDTNTRMGTMSTPPLVHHHQQRSQPQSPSPSSQQASPSSTSSSPIAGGTSTIRPSPGQASSSSSSNVDLVDVEDELLLSENAVSKLFPNDSLTTVEELVDLDQIDVDHILNENNFLNNINNLNFLDEALGESVESSRVGSAGENLVISGDSSSGNNSGNNSGYSVESGGPGGSPQDSLLLPADDSLVNGSEMQLTQQAMAATLQQQQQQLSGTGSPVPVSTEESVNALLNAKIDNLLGIHQHQQQQQQQQQHQQQRSQVRPPSQEDALLLADLEQESLEEACNSLIRDMNEYGVCVLDNFLGQERGLKVLHEVTNMYSSGVFKALAWVPSHCSIPGNEKADSLAKLDKKEGILVGDPSCSETLFTFTNVFAAPRQKMSLISLLFFIRFQAMVACYPGHGSHYVKHVDNPNKDGRCITAIYYLNLNWDVRTSGGLLRIFPEGCNDRVADIEPVFDRILFFWSDRRNPHEVQPSHRTRYAITLWYLDAEERESARLRYQRDCENTRFSA
ncbi:hypothetical protein RP20_CCG009139 [Aedes albopictus]|nr:hypothetical protein RP20_CCG009139 [Aedes albopictus]